MYRFIDYKTMHQRHVAHLWTFHFCYIFWDRVTWNWTAYSRWGYAILLQRHYRMLRTVFYPNLQSPQYPLWRLMQRNNLVACNVLVLLRCSHNALLIQWTHPFFHRLPACNTLQEFLITCIYCYATGYLFFNFLLSLPSFHQSTQVKYMILMTGFTCSRVPFSEDYLSSLNNLLNLVI